jgi:hypothetical protein
MRRSARVKTPRCGARSLAGEDVTECRLTLLQHPPIPGANQGGAPTRASRRPNGPIIFFIWTARLKSHNVRFKEIGPVSKRHPALEPLPHPVCQKRAREPNSRRAAATFALELPDLIDPALMAAAFEFGFHPDFDYPFDAARA